MNMRFLFREDLAGGSRMRNTGGVPLCPGRLCSPNRDIRPDPAESDLEEWRICANEHLSKNRMTVQMEPNPGTVRSAEAAESFGSAQCQPRHRCLLRRQTESQRNFVHLPSRVASFLQSNRKACATQKDARDAAMMNSGEEKELR